MNDSVRLYIKIRLHSFPWSYSWFCTMQKLWRGEIHSVKVQPHPLKELIKNLRGLDTSRPFKWEELGSGKLLKKTCFLKHVHWPYWEWGWPRENIPDRRKLPTGSSSTSRGVSVCPAPFFLTAGKPRSFTPRDCGQHWMFGLENFKEFFQGKFWWFCFWGSLMLWCVSCVELLSMHEKPPFSLAIVFNLQKRQSQAVCLPEITY